MKRRAGLLMPVASLPSDYGVGDFGKNSMRFVDFLKKAGMKIWQILPLNPLGYGNSPYQPYSSMAGDELYIDLDALVEQKLLGKKPPVFMKHSSRIDYDAVRAYKQGWLRLAFEQFTPTAAYRKFIAQSWVYDYAVFRTFMHHNGDTCWVEWPKPYQNWIHDRKLDLTPFEEDIEYEMFVQYLFASQWAKLKKYANSQGIQIMGDMPFYVGLDSLDVWANQEEFLLGADGNPTFIAGVPPDYFSATGQRWGNPIYNWKAMEQNAFAFWMNRVAYSSKLFDITRIDHFRAFDTYWKIPASCPTAVEGEWVEAPGYAFFDALYARYPKLQIVAEDLGDMRPEVYTLRDHYHLKGMKVVQFTFDPLEHNNDFEDRRNMIVYTGTHDNDTVRGWMGSQTRTTQHRAKACLLRHGYEVDNIGHAFVQYAFENIAEIAIVPVQDVLNLGHRGRLNTPGTVGSPNWEWRLAQMHQLEAQSSFLREAAAAAKR